MGWFDSFDINSIINPETIKNQVGGDGIKLATGQMSIEDAAKKAAMKGLTGGMEVPGTELNATLSSQPDLLGKMDSGITGQGTIQIPNSTEAITPYEGLTTSPANITEEPSTFLGLEGKDYAKMGVGAGLNAAVGMAMQPPAPQKPTPPPTPNRPGAYQAPQQSQGMAQTLAVNSNANPAGYTPMTQAEGLLNPFQRDRYRRGQY